jgi:hypothetical protein
MRNVEVNDRPILLYGSMYGDEHNRQICSEASATPMRQYHRNGSPNTGDLISNGDKVTDGLTENRFVCDMVSSKRDGGIGEIRDS